MPVRITQLQLGSAFEERYTLEHQLGMGGMATVYLATDLKLNRKVALKLLRPELRVALGTERFLREIEIAARLNHPHILSLHDSGEAGGHLYYAMPYVHGESLRQRLEREGQLPIDEIIATVRAIANALTYAHQAGVVHRDIKPENILLTQDDVSGIPYPLIADFGIARALDVAAGDRLTETGLALGTPAYMSPEQAAGGRIDGRSDIYALGCVAYEMLAGTPPFTGPTAQAIMARHAVDPVPRLRTVRSTIPLALEGAIERALAKVPADRFATAEDFAQALTTEAARRSSRRIFASGPTRRTLGYVAGIGILGAGAILAREFTSPVVAPSASRIAVLPFLSAGADTGLTRLGRDLAATISASLDGIEGIETADRISIATAVNERHGLSAAEGAALARRLGASSFVRGTLVRSGNNVRLDLGLYKTDGLAPLAEGIAVTADQDDIGSLADSASFGLLRHIWRRGEPIAPSLGTSTTHSITALRAFLQGERELGANRWNEAAVAFQSAIAADSTFWLAYFRYALARWWSGETAEPEILKGLRLHRQVLPERERLLAEAFLDSTATPAQRIGLFQVATQRFFTYWPAWFLYADALFHSGPEVGRDWTESLQAFRQVVALNPKLVPAWEHIFLLTLEKDQAEASNSWARLISLGWLQEQEPWRRLLFRLQAGVGQVGGVVPAELGLLADSLAAFLVSSPNEYVMKLGAVGVPLLQEGFPVAQLDLNRRALARNHRAMDPGTRSFRVRTGLEASNAWSWAARGQWDSALTIIGKVAAERPGVIGPPRYSPPTSPAIGGPVLAIESYALAVVGAWLGAAAPEAAKQRRAAAISAIEPLVDEESRRDARGRVAWLDGILGFALLDRGKIQAARREAARSGYSQAKLVDRSLAAFDLALTGDKKGAGRELAQLEDNCFATKTCNSFTPHAAVQRLAAAQWLLEGGDADQALRMARWQDATQWYGFLWFLNDALRGPGYLTRARIEEARGEPRLASQYYQKFIKRYDRPSPSQVRSVEVAKARLARVSAPTAELER
jgi:TolB-like protein/tetratricopeptide (TPR) repeat protein